MSKSEPSPNKIPWPPILLVLFLLAAAALGRTAPVPWPASLDTGATTFFGVVILAAGLSLELWTITYFGTMKSNVLPNRPAGKLLTGGPFNFSRNPIYLGNTLLVFSFALIFSNLWFIAAALALFIATSKLAVAREEAHLAEKFGQDWHDYADRVRRWM